MHSSSSATEILQALEAAEPSQATAGLDWLILRLRAEGSNGLDLPGLWKSFKRLLHRRGYFVSTSAEVTASLDEISGVGEGFDLYELARKLAEYDAIRTECLRLRKRRVLPQLKRFSPTCPCGKHRKEK